jgi:phosphoglycolate phosphatase
MPGVPEGEYSRIAERYRYHFLSQDHELTLFDGAFDLVSELRETGCLLGVATGKSRLGLNRALDSTRLGDFFHATRCADECSSKPAPDMLLELMEELDVAPDQTLMIGDTTHDLQMARNAGVGSLGVGFGAHSRNELALESPLALFDSLSELSEWMRRHG